MSDLMTAFHRACLPQTRTAPANVPGLCLGRMSGCGPSRRFVRRTDSVAIGGIADLRERIVLTNSVENDPHRTCGSDGGDLVSDVQNLPA
jgi:hypothetical protein